MRRPTRRARFLLWGHREYLRLTAYGLIVFLFTYPVAAYFAKDRALLVPAYLWILLIPMMINYTVIAHRQRIHRDPDLGQVWTMVTMVYPVALVGVVGCCLYMAIWGF